MAGNTLSKFRDKLSQDQLAQLMMQQNDPRKAHWMAWERQRQQDAAANGLPMMGAQTGYAATPVTDPITMYPETVVRAAPTGSYDPAQRNYEIMMAMGRNSPRGRAQALANTRNNARLRQTISELMNKPMPAEQEPSRLMQILMHMTGQGGGMRP